MISIEGGVAWSESPEHDNTSGHVKLIPNRRRRLECFAYVVAMDGRTGAESVARSASFTLPPAVADLVEGGMELGDADDQVFRRVASGYVLSFSLL